jgi:hypothetical protein
MKRIILGSLATLAIACGAMLPASAEEPRNPVDEILSVPLNVVGLGTGLAVGLPVSITDKVVDNFSSAWDFLNRGATNPLTPVVTALPAAYVGTFAGVLEGTSNGFKNALDNYERPFSAESMSLANFD